MVEEGKKNAVTPVRLPPTLKDFLKHAAIDNRRTLSNEIIFRLEQSCLTVGARGDAA